jgi:hypothetical protein
LYFFSHFVPKSISIVFISQSNDISSLWHEIFFHLNYKYFHQLSKENMVEGLPAIKFTSNVCQGCILGKHPEKNFDKGKAQRASSPLGIIHSEITGPFPYTSISIQLQHTVPYTPQQNGVAERKNQSLKEMENCMLQSKSLDPKIWAEDIHCEAYIQNQFLHKSLKGTTPFEFLTGKKPKVLHFCIFGSREWAHILTDKRKALEPQSFECIFFGYPKGVKGYILLDSHTENFILARSVKFEEESLHDFLEDPAEEPLVVTDEEESKTSSSTSEHPSEKPFRSDIEDADNFMASPSQLPTWAEKTLQDGCR